MVANRPGLVVGPTSHRRHSIVMSIRTAPPPPPPAVVNCGKMAMAVSHVSWHHGAHRPRHRPMLLRNRSKIVCVSGIQHTQAKLQSMRSSMTSIQNSSRSRMSSENNTRQHDSAARQWNAVPGMKIDDDEHNHKEGHVLMALICRHERSNGNEIKRLHWRINERLSLPQQYHDDIRLPR